MNPLHERFDRICERLERAVARSGRQKGSVGLVAVSKLHTAAEVADLAAYWAASRPDFCPGGRGPVFGENYMQEAREKMEETARLLAERSLHSTSSVSSSAGESAPVLPEWHFVGHVQSKKARDLAGRFTLIHSVDSLKLASSLQKAWDTRVAGAPVGLNAPAPEPQAVLIQVNVGREPQKSGVDPEGLEELARSLLAMPGLSLRGLMCLPPLAEIGEHSRPYFVMLRELRDTLQGRLGIALPELSMGMSDDFEAAVEEGATLVRIGTDIFGPRT